MKVIASTDLEDFEGGSVQETHDTHTHTLSHRVCSFHNPQGKKWHNGKAAESEDLKVIEQKL